MSYDLDVTRDRQRRGAASRAPAPGNYALLHSFLWMRFAAW
jgi:hypothetical protein